MEKINLKKLIAEAREIAESLDEFADKLEKIEIDEALDEQRNKREKEWERASEKLNKAIRYSDNGFPYFVEELTEDDLDERQKTIWTNPRTENY
jgi:hypothetical protein